MTVSSSSAIAVAATGAPPTTDLTGAPLQGSDAITAHQNHLHLFTPHW
jgi:hypothetical protein